MLGLLASPYCSVVPQEVIEKLGRDFRKHPVGTGPFTFHFWEERNSLVLHKFAGYFEKDNSNRPLPYVDAIQVSFISDKQSAFFEFLKGKLDFFSGLDASYKDDLLTGRGELRPKYKGKFNLQTSPYLNTEYLGFLIDSSLALTQSSSLMNVKIRQAISLGFDRGKMIRFLRNGMAIPGTAGIVPPGMPGFSSLPVNGYGYDPVRARQLLAEAGYPEGKGLPEITLSTTGSYLDLCEYIQGELAHLGIRIRIEVNQAGQHRQMVARQQLAFFRASWIADYADPENYLSLFRSQNHAPKGPNTTHFSNARFDALYEQALNTCDVQARNLLYISMDSLLMSEPPVVILYYDKAIRLTQNRITGLGINPMNMLNLKTVQIRKDN
jgi:peptide/nickel transport system substrate-binding protein